MDIGLAIKHHRTERGMTLKELAEASGKSVSFLSDIERGASEPSLNSLHAIADAMQLHTVELIEADNFTDESEWALIQAWRSGNINQLLAVISIHWQDRN